MSIERELPDHLKLFTTVKSPYGSVHSYSSLGATRTPSSTRTQKHRMAERRCTGSYRTAFEDAGGVTSPTSSMYGYAHITPEASPGVTSRKSSSSSSFPPSPAASSSVQPCYSISGGQTPNGGLSPPQPAAAGTTTISQSLQTDDGFYSYSESYKASSRNRHRTRRSLYSENTYSKSSPTAKPKINSRVGKSRAPLPQEQHQQVDSPRNNKNTSDAAATIARLKEENAALLEELRHSQELAQQVLAARRAVGDALSEVSAQNSRLVAAWMDEKQESEALRDEIQRQKSDSESRIRRLKSELAAARSQSQSPFPSSTPRHMEYTEEYYTPRSRPAAQQAYHGTPDTAPSPSARFAFNTNYHSTIRNNNYTPRPAGQEPSQREDGAPIDSTGNAPYTAGGRGGCWEEERSELLSLLDKLQVQLSMHAELDHHHHHQHQATASPQERDQQKGEEQQQSKHNVQDEKKKGGNVVDGSATPLASTEWRSPPRHSHFKVPSQQREERNSGPDSSFAAAFTEFSRRFTAGETTTAATTPLSCKTSELKSNQVYNYLATDDDTRGRKVDFNDTFHTPVAVNLAASFSDGASAYKSAVSASNDSQASARTSEGSASDNDYDPAVLNARPTKFSSNASVGIGKNTTGAAAKNDLPGSLKHKAAGNTDSCETSPLIKSIRSDTDKTTNTPGNDKEEIRDGSSTTDDSMRTTTGEAEIRAQVDKLKKAGDAALRRLQYNDAIQQYTSAVQLCETSLGQDTALTARLLCSKASALLTARKFLDAAAECSRARKMDACCHRALDIRAECFVAMGSWDLAVKDLAELLPRAEPYDRCSVRARLEDGKKRAKDLHNDSSSSTVSSLDCYAVMNLKPHASASDVKSAYRALALKLHPDKAGQALGATEAGALFSLVSAAHAALSDVDARREHDLQLLKRKYGRTVGVTSTRMF